MAKKETKKVAEEEEKKEGTEAAPAEGEATEGEKKKPSKKMIIIIAVAAVLVLGGIAAALVFTGVLGGKKPEANTEHVEGMPAGEDKAHGKEGEKAKEGKKEGAVFYDLGEIVVNLQADGRRQTFLKLVVQLEMESEEDKAAIEVIKPRIVDNFQTYLRELRMDDLRGSAGLYRLREELLFRVTEAAHPIKVKDVLFQQMLVQ